MNGKKKEKRKSDSRQKKRPLAREATKFFHPLKQNLFCLNKSTGKITIDKMVVILQWKKE